MPRIAAGLLMYRLREGTLEVLLAHPGGPYFANKDDGAWTLPKGEPDPGEQHDSDDHLLAVAEREFREETGLTPTGEYLPLGSIKQKGGKVVHAWAFAGDCDPSECHSNLFTMEWPPRSGRVAEFPEMDRAEWFDLATARVKLKDTQVPFLERLAEQINPQY